MLTLIELALRWMRLPDMPLRAKPCERVKARRLDRKFAQQEDFSCPIDISEGLGARQILMFPRMPFG